MRYSLQFIACALFGGVLMFAAGLDLGPVAYWSADDLKSGHASGLPLITATHAYTLMRLAPGATLPAESHEGTTDVFFVLAGSAAVQIGSGIDGGSALPGKPGEIRGRSVKGGRSYDLKPGAAISIPPSAAFMMVPGPAGLTAMRLKINVGMHPWSLASTQQTTLPVTPAHPRITVPLNSEQGGVVYWPADVLQKTQQTLAAAAARGEPAADPRELLDLPATRTHAWNFLHRVMGANGQPPGLEFHEGTTDVYFITSGTGTLMAGGEVVNKEMIPARPGEYRGSSIRNGHGYRIKAGDVINMPPSTPHQSVPDPGGFSYVLIKVNTGMYPWSLVDLEK